MIEWLRSNQRTLLIAIPLLLVCFLLFNPFKNASTEIPTPLLPAQTSDVQAIEETIDLAPISSILVDIKGKITSPGVYQVNQGDRVIDLIELAGGTTEDAEMTTVNLSLKLHDEMVVYIPGVDEEIPDDSYLWLKPNDILIQRSNSIDYVGISAIYNGMPQQYIYPDLMMKIQCIDEVNVKFLHYTLLNKSVREYYRRKSKGTSNSMKKINQKVVENTPILLPPLAEQKRIVAEVDQLMHLCDELKTQLSQSKKDSEMLMQAVLQEAFGTEQ